MAATTATTAVAVLRDWRGWPDVLAALWRRSLRFRTLAITLVATSLAILITCVTMALVIQNDLFVSRKNVALEDARRAVDQAQSLLDVAEVGDDPAALTDLWNGIPDTLSRTSSADLLAGFKIQDGSGTVRLNGFTAGA